VAAIASIALGIAGNVTIFSVVNAVLLRPLPFKEPDRLASVRLIAPDGFSLGVLGIHVVDWRNHVQSIESIEAVHTSLRNMRNLDGPGEPERLGAVRITAEFFDLLGFKPQAGRWFIRAEEDRRAPDVVIISDTLWRRHFSADRSIIGQKIMIDGRPHEVVGVTPPDMHFFRGHQLDRGDQGGVTMLHWTLSRSAFVQALGWT